MAKFNTTIVTNAGKQLFAKVRAGKERLTWTKAQMYYASNFDSLPKTMLQQATPDYFGGALKETNVGVVEIKGTTVTISSSFLNENQLSDLTFNLIGWFANSSLDQEEKLVAITPSVGEQILTAGATNGKATASIDLVLAIDVGDANIVKITPIEEGLIDHTELNNALALLASKGLINTGNDITSSQNVNLDEHFNTSLQYIDDALSDIGYGNFSGTGWLISLGNKDNKNNQNNVQFVVDSGTDGNGVGTSKLIYRTYNSSGKYWNNWSNIVTSDNIRDYLPKRLIWSNNTDSDDITDFGSGITYDPDEGGRIRLNLGVILNEITWGSNYWFDDDQTKRILSTDGKSGTTENLLINHAQLMQELGNYYTKNDADQKFETKLDAMKFAKSSDVYTKIQSDKKYYDKQTTDYNIANAIVIQNREGLQKYKLETIDESSVSGRYILAGTAQHPTNLPNIPQLNNYEGIYLEVHNESGNIKPFVKVIPTDDKSKFYSNYLFRFYIGTFDRSGAINWNSYASDDNYYDRDTIDKMIANAGQVKTVNNVKPDDKGNVQINIPDSYTKQESDNQFETKQDLKTRLAKKNDEITHAKLQQAKNGLTFNTTGNFSNTADLGDVSMIDNTVYFDPQKFIDGLSSNTLENPLMSKKQYMSIPIRTAKDLEKYNLKTISKDSKQGIYVFFNSGKNYPDNLPLEVKIDKNTTMYLKIFNAGLDKVNGLDGLAELTVSSPKAGFVFYLKGLEYDSPWYKFSSTAVQ